MNQYARSIKEVTLLLTVILDGEKNRRRGLINNNNKNKTKKSSAEFDFFLLYFSTSPNLDFDHFQVMCMLTGVLGQSLYL